MGSPLSPVVADLYMEDFEQQTLQPVTVKPTPWLKCIDDTFIIWPQHMDYFLTHLNNIHKNIQFIMEREENK